MVNQVIALYVGDEDIRNGYFVLSDVITKLPKDVALVDSRSSYSSAHTIFRLRSKEFPEIPAGHVAPAAYFKYNAGSGIEIAWPTTEYENIMLRLHNEAIEESVNKDADVMEYEGGVSANLAKIFEAYNKVQANGSYEEPVLLINSSKCQHEWFMYGRSAAFKHCKKCAMIRENIVDKE